MRTTTKLRSMLKTGTTVVAPGVYDGLTARLVEKAGFPAAYVSGGAVARGSGIPDVGLVSLSETAARLERHCRLPWSKFALEGRHDTGTQEE